MPVKQGAMVMAGTVDLMLSDNNHRCAYEPWMKPLLDDLPARNSDQTLIKHTPYHW